jgi:gliding motility-associated lipoprotein GldH
VILRTLRSCCLLAFLAGSLSSCDSSVLFEENVRIPDNRWDAANVIKLNAEIPDTAQLYNVYVNVRNAGGYPYSNIFLFLNTTLPDGKRSRDTLEVTLADEKGQWLGDGMGDIWDNRVLFRENMHFPQSGRYTFQLEQAMRQNPLPQIMDVGLRIEKAGATTAR